MLGAGEAVSVAFDAGNIRTKVVDRKVAEAEGVRLEVNWDTTTFIERSIREILLTLVLAWTENSGVLPIATYAGGSWLGTFLTVRHR